MRARTAALARSRTHARTRGRETCEQKRGGKKARERGCAPGAKVKYAAAPASRSIMRRVTHAGLLHCEPCYASARQGAWRIYGGISAVIERYAPSSRYLFPPGRSLAARSTVVASQICEWLPKTRELASTCSENIEGRGRTSELINQFAIFDARSRETLGSGANTSSGCERAKTPAIRI